MRIAKRMNLGDAYSKPPILGTEMKKAVTSLV